MKRIWATILLIWIVLPLGCLNGGSPVATESTIAIETIYRSANCPLDQPHPHATWIDNHTQWENSWNRLNRSIVKDTPSTVPPVDFSQQGILRVAMGQQPTGGYALELADGKCTVKNNTATVTLRWIRPDPGNVVAQMITKPCILLKVPRKNFCSIRIKDQFGKHKQSVALPNCR